MILVTKMFSRRTFISILFASCLAVLSWLNFTPLATALGGKLPEINRPAPDFTLPTNTGDGQISLSEFRGKWLVLYFYPKDFTAGCTLEARRFQQDLPKYIDKNATIVGVSADDINSHAKFCDSEGLKFPLLADTTGAVSKAYGSWIGFVSMRHSFLIDPDGVLRETFVNVNPAIHSTEVLARLEQLQSAS
jgi:peroxiredoxin Q/BCP